MTQAARRPDQQGWALRRLLDIHDGLRTDQLETHLGVEEERLAPALNALSRVLPEDRFAAPPRPRAS